MCLNTQKRFLQIQLTDFPQTVPGRPCGLSRYFIVYCLYCQIIDFQIKRLRKGLVFPFYGTMWERLIEKFRIQHIRFTWHKSTLSIMWASTVAVWCIVTKYFQGKNSWYESYTASFILDKVVHQDISLVFQSCETSMLKFSVLRKKKNSLTFTTSFRQMQKTNALVLG